MDFRKHSWIICGMSLVMLNCFSSEKSLPEITGVGNITGRVVGYDGVLLPGVQVTTSYQGNAYQTTTASNGTFSLSINDVERGSGLNMQFAKANFENASQAALISLPNLKVDIGDVTMYVVGGTEVKVRKITGQIIDNFTYKPLADASVATIDSAGQVVIVTTNLSGKFELSSSYFALQSSFAIMAYKANYITRTDIVAVITAEDNPIKNNPFRLYQKFGSVYGYVTSYGFATSTPAPPPPNAPNAGTLGYLNDVSATLTTSNNQVITCKSGGPYDPEPLAPNKFCPDMDDNFITPSAGLNGGGFKIKDTFLLLGNRYPVTLSKTNANCTARAAGARDCYRPKTQYVDVLLTGNNAISGGGTIELQWDAWISGSVTVQDPSTGAAIKPHTFCTGLWSSYLTCAGANVTVKLYDSSNKYITQTITDGAGAYRLESSQIIHDQTYKLTFEATGAYSRLIGYTDSAHPQAPSPPLILQSPVPVTITIAGQNSPAVNPTLMTALPPPSHCVKGTVTDYWSTLPVSGATVAVFDGGWRTATTDALGQFVVNGVFTNPAVDSYPVQISQTGYTGENDIYVQKFSFTHNTTLVACPAAAFDLDSNAVGACNATGAGPTGGTNCATKLVLHPIGVYASINGGSKYFKNQTKQTYEKFLTEKAGLTISSRTGDLQLTSSSPQKTYDYDGIYLHFDDTPKVLPNVPEGRWSNHVPINPSSSSPVVNGVLTEGIMGDSRITPWELKTYVYYHFYASVLGSYTIETTGTTDTYMTLIAQTGSNLGNNDDGGSGSNASMTVNLLPGWYYVKISSKNDNIFGFFDVNVTGPSQDETGYASMLSPIGPSYQLNGGLASYGTNCTAGNGNMVVSWYDAVGHLLYIAAPGENGGCSATGTIEKHGPIGDIIRGRFDGSLRPVAPSGANATVASGTFKGYFNIIRTE